MMSAVHTIEYSSAGESEWDGQKEMTKAGPSEQMTSGLRPEGQEEGGHVKMAGGTFQIEGVHSVHPEWDWSMWESGWWMACQLGIKPGGPW